MSSWYQGAINATGQDAAGPGQNKERIAGRVANCNGATVREARITIRRPVNRISNAKRVARDRVIVPVTAQVDVLADGAARDQKERPRQDSLNAFRDRNKLTHKSDYTVHRLLKVDQERTDAVIGGRFYFGHHFATKQVSNIRPAARLLPAGGDGHANGESTAGAELARSRAGAARDGIDYARMTLQRAGVTFPCGTAFPFFQSTPP